MRWRDLDLEREVWTLPRELTKSDRAHVVPLSVSAIEIIEGLPQLGELVFPAMWEGSRSPVSGFSRAKGRLVSTQSLNGAPFRSAPGFLASTGT